MKQIKSIILVAALILTMCLGLIMPAAAAESAVLWLEVQTNETGVLVKVCANTTLTDGRIDVRYDYRTMSYSDIAVAEEYVLAHAVNAEKGGVVQIAWVASGDYNMDGKDHVLMQLQFAGENIDGYSVSGYAFSPEGTQYTVTPPEGLDRLLAAVESAKALKSEMYTTDSYAKLQAALDAARAEMLDPNSNAERMEAARQNVIEAVRGLIKWGEEPVVPETTAPTVPATQPVASQQDNNVALIAVIVAVCVVAAVVVVILIKRKGNK